MSPVCRFPGCTVELGFRNTTGCCKTHVHRAGYCTCAKCVKRAMPENPVEERVRVADRPGLTQVMIPRARKGLDLDYVPVTLPVPAWERGR